MKTKLFNGKKITIRELSRNDLKKADRFQEHMNSLIKEDVMILTNKKISPKEEKEYLKEELQKIKNRKKLKLVAEKDNLIVGMANIPIGMGRKSHVGDFGISINKGYRGIGLGTYLTNEVIKLAKKRLRPRPQIIRLSVFATNKPALGLYKKLGFRQVARIPKQYRYKGKLIDEIIMMKEV
jgi:ribosomal protein S18 acetylase RimI-like enzyme